MIRSVFTLDINVFFQELDELFRTNQIDKVEPYILSQMVVANQQHNTDASLAIINELIGFYRSQNRFEESIRVSKQALDLCKHEYILGSISHATTLLNAATAYRFAGKPQEAMELYEQAEAIYRDQLNPFDERNASLYNNISAACSDLGQNDRAVDYLLRATAIMDAIPQRIIESAVSHANLAALYAKMQNWHGAKSHIATACNTLRDRPEAAAQYAQFKALQDMFESHPD